MTATQNLQQLKEDVLNIKQSTSDLMKMIKDKRHEMTPILRAELTQVKIDIETAEKDRRKEATNDHKQRIEENNQRKADILLFRQDLQKEYRGMALAWQGVSSSMKSTVVSDTETTTTTAIIEETNAKEDASGDDDKQELFESSNAIQDHLIISTSSKDSESESEPKEKAPVYKEDKVVEVTDNSDHSDTDLEQLKRQVANTLKDYSDGLKMTQVAELLDIDQWRTLIPVMRELQQLGIIRKDGYLYCSA